MVGPWRYETNPLDDISIPLPATPTGKFYRDDGSWANAPAAMTGAEIRDALLALSDVNRGVVITNPGSGDFRVISIERLASGAIQITYSDIAEI